MKKNDVNIYNIKELLDNIYFIYYLGFLWGDGNISKSNYNITLKINTKDIENIENILNSVNLNYHKYINNSYDKRTNKIYNSTLLIICNKYLHSFLKECDYDKKSYISPNKIINLISNDNIKYFIRGYFDADGCIYIKNTKIQLTICSTLNQDWYFIEKIFKNLNIKYTFYISKNLKSKFSQIRINNFLDNMNFLNFIYNDNENISLNRKYLKYLECKNIHLINNKLYEKKNS